MSYDREEVVQVAYDLKMLPLTEQQISWVMIMVDNEAEQDPTGKMDLWIENLLCQVVKHPEDFNEEIDDLINDLFEDIKKQYSSSFTLEITSGEFILSVEIPKVLQGWEYTNYMVITAVNKFLEWDSTEDGRYATVGIKLEGDKWTIHDLDCVEYKGKIYPVRIFAVTIDGDDDPDWIHYYQIAPESLVDRMHELEGEDCFDKEQEAYYVDQKIYHYVQDCVFYADAEYVCKNCLDVPMTLVEGE
jgi:hypothetical protein